MKKWFGWIAAVFLVLFLAVQVILIFYNDSIRLKIEAEIDKNINAHITFEDIHLSLWRHFPNVTLDFREVLIKGIHEFERDTLIATPSMGVELDVLSFFKDEIKIKSILFDNPHINLLVLEDGKANYFIAKSRNDSTTTDSTSLKVDIEQVIINEGNLVYNNKENNIRVTISDFQHKGKGDFVKDIFDYSTQTFFRELTVDHNQIRYLDKKQTSVELAMQIDTRHRKFTIQKNTISINHFKLGLEGYFTLLEDGYDMDLRFTAQETSLKNILSVLPGIFIKDMEHITTGGEASFHGFLSGKYSSDNDTLPAFRMDLKIKNGFFKIDTLAAPLKKIECDLVIDHTKGPLEEIVFDLQTVHFEVGNQPIDGRVKLQGLDRFKIDADLTAGLNLHEIETIYPLKGIQLAGRADLKFKAKGNFVRGIENGPNKRAPVIPSFSIDFLMKNGNVRYDALPAGLNNIGFHFTMDNHTGKVENTSLRIEDINMKIDSISTVAGYIKVSGFNDFKIDADIKSDLDLADLERVFPIKGLTVKGNLNTEVKIEGDYDMEKKLFPLVDAKFELKNGYVKSDNYPEPLQDIHLISEVINKTGRIANSQLFVKQFTYTMEGEPFTASGTVADFEKYAYDFKIKGTVDLDKLTKIYPIENMKLSGRVFSNIETIGKISDLETGNYSLTYTKGFVKLKNIEVSGDKLPLPVKVEEASFVFSPEKIVMKKFTGKVGKSTLKATGDLFNYMYFFTENDDLIRGDLKVECDTLDLNQWITPLQNSTIVTSTSSGRSSKIEVIEVPKNFDFTFDSDIKNVHYQDLKITSLIGQIRIKDGMMTLHETGFNSLDAQFSVDGDYDTRDMNHPLFDFKIDVKELDIAKAYKEIKLVRDLAPAAADCEGQISVNYALKGELDKGMYPRTETMVGGGRMRIANAKIDGMRIFEELSKAAKRESINNPHLKDFVMDTEIRDNRVFIKPFNIKVSGFNTEIEGVNELTGAIQYLIKIELLPIERLRIPFHVTGTYDDPKVAIGRGHKLPE
jgi:AsmA protein